LSTEEAEPFIEKDDLAGLVAFLDEQGKPQIGGVKKIKKRPGRNQRRAARAAKEAAALASAVPKEEAGVGKNEEECVSLAPLSSFVA
jgi:hypothetical protein